MFTRVVILSLLLCAPVSQGALLLSTNSTWRFFRGTNEASLPDTTSWRSNTFNDASFTDMAAPFWYGDVRPGGSQLTDMQGTYSCFFLRKTFTVNNAAQIGGKAPRRTRQIPSGTKDAPSSLGQPRAQLIAAQIRP